MRLPRDVAAHHVYPPTRTLFQTGPFDDMLMALIRHDGPDRRPQWFMSAGVSGRKGMRHVRWFGWVVILAAVVVGAMASTQIITRGLSVLFGSILLAAVAVTILALCGRLPGESFSGDSSPTRAHDSLHYP